MKIGKCFFKKPFLVASKKIIWLVFYNTVWDAFCPTVKRSLIMNLLDHCLVLLKLEVSGYWLLPEYSSIVLVILFQAFPWLLDQVCHLDRWFHYHSLECQLQRELSNWPPVRVSGLLGYLVCVALDSFWKLPSNCTRFWFWALFL